MNHLFEKLPTPSLTQNWQQQLSEAFDNIADLCRFLQLSPHDLPISLEASQQFALRVPLSFAANMAKGNPHDPLLRQVLPITDELRVFPGFSNDPVGDLASVAQPGVLHKYQGRVLLINTGSCAINCRYCFRRNFPYGDWQLSRQKQAAALTYIAGDSGITEVIFSGGDPLLLNDVRLGQLFTELDTISHVKRLRIHTRLPIVLPARITSALIEVLAASCKQVVVVVHCNHPNELGEEVRCAIAALKGAGITLFNQSVLLKGINDDVDILCDLSERLFQFGIMPYYLHVLDKANGTGHFEVSRVHALGLHQHMQARLPGYLVPKLVEELAGGVSKQAVF